jgi:hypothetical protein
MSKGLSRAIGISVFFVSGSVFTVAGILILSLFLED